MSQKRYSMGSYAISINGEQVFTVSAVSQIGAVIMAAVDQRFKTIHLERKSEPFMMTATRIEDM